MFAQIKLQLKPSSVVAALLTLPTCAAIVLLLSLALPSWISGTLVALNLGLLHYYLGLLSRLSRPASIIQIRISEREITLYDAAGRVVNATLNRYSFVSRWLCMLTFDCLITDRQPAKVPHWLRFSARFGEQRSVLLCHDNVTSRDDLRRLRVLLNYGNFSQTNSITPQ